MSNRNLLIAGVVLALATGVACRKPVKVILTKDQRARIEENILKAAPTPKTVIGANFGDNIKLIGAEIGTDKAKAGETVVITYYWEVLRETPGEWKVFGHLELPAGKRMILDHVPVGELYPIGQWKKGEIIRDVQKVALDGDTKPGMATLWAGLFNEEIYRERGGGDRMQLVNKDKVQNDGDNRVRVLQFQVVGADGSATPKPAPTLKAYKAREAIKVDGRASEPDWALAIESPAFPMASGAAGDANKAVTVKALYDDASILLFFHVLDAGIEADKKNRDDELWTQDCVEVYLDPKADGQDYLELQVSPNNIVFDALFKTHRTPDWKDARAFSVAGLETAVSVTGTPNKADDADTGYDVEIRIPFASIPGFDKVPPETGSFVRANFFRMEAQGGKVVGANAYSPTGGDFHDLAKAGRIEFAGTPADLVQKVGAASIPKVMASPAGLPAAQPKPQVKMIQVPPPAFGKAASSSGGMPKAPTATPAAKPAGK